MVLAKKSILDASSQEGVGHSIPSIQDENDLVRIAPGFFGYLSPMGVVLGLNDLALSVIESTRAQIVGQLFWECPWWKPISSSALKIQKAVLRCVQGEVSRFDTEYWSIQGGCGEKRWVAIEIVPVYNDQANITRVAVTGIDITDRKTTEEALYRSQEQLAKAVSVSKIGFYDWNILQNFMTFSDQMREDWGICELGLTLEDAIKLIHEEDQDRVVSAVKKAIEGHQKYFSEYRVVRPDGEIIWIEAQGEITYDEDQQPMRFFGTSIDITERRKNQLILENGKDAIENERENFYKLFRQTPEMVCVLSGPNHVFEFVNDSHIRALGFSAVGMSVRDAQPESIEVHGILDNVYRSGVTAELRELPVTLTNHLRYFNLTYSARRDLAGNINGIMILGSEVTEVVRARQILESNEKALQQFLDAIPATLWSAEADGTMAFVNQFWKSYSGQQSFMDPRQEGWSEVFHPEDRERTIHDWNSAVLNGLSIDQQFRLRRAKDGEYRWHRSRGAPLRDENGKITR